jgi:hypothetical protein
MSGENIFVINERPFSSAMKVSYQLGIDQKLTWTYVIDADILLKEGAVKEMLAVIEKMPGHTLGISGELLDKLHGAKRSAGNHLFRTKYLARLIDHIKSYENESIRPESSAIRQLHQQGYIFKKNRLFIGLHDFEQHYYDIARKAFTHSKKHSKHLSEFISFWTRKAPADHDFKAALFGLSKSVLYQNDVKINADDFVQLNKEVTEQFGRKSEAVSDFSITSFDDVMEAMHDQANYFTADAELNQKYEKKFRSMFNELSYLNIIKSVLGKIVHDIKK